MTRLFIDGSVGTTGLEIRERIAGRADIELITLDEAQRKQASARRDALNAAEIVILCLPDDAAKEAVSLIDNATTKVIDASTAHRTAPGWIYGFPEFKAGQYDRILASSRIANPGCYATGFLALMAPLVAQGLLKADWQYSCNAVSGYSGGGKSMIAAYEDANAADAVDSAWQTYALKLGHKHVPEMQHQAGLGYRPLFTPAVVPTYRGMVVEVPLQVGAAGCASADALRDGLMQHYAGRKLVRVADKAECAAMDWLPVETSADSDRVDLFVFGSDQQDQLRLIATLDNLGKGAGGAAVQTMNLLMGVDEATGLRA
jgi:N-acetyl-gamma-glutamyl-phosphate reductase